MTDRPARDPRQPVWPLADLHKAAEAHWSDAPRLRLLLRDLGQRRDAADLAARVTARLRELPPEPRLRVIRRDPAPARPKAPPLPQTPTPEMATLLRDLALERASGDSARQEAALLRQRLQDQRATPEDRLLQELEAARAEAKAAREEAARLAQRLAFATASPSRRVPDPGHAPADPPPPTRSRLPTAPDPAYAELGLSPDLPDDLLPVLERAFLRHHHPDRARPDGREAATVRFQAVTKAFDRIRRIRGL